MESEERLWLLLQLQACRHAVVGRKGGWGKAAASQKIAVGAGLHSLSLSVRATSPDRRFITPSILMQYPDSPLSVLLHFSNMDPCWSLLKAPAKSLVMRPAQRSHLMHEWLGIIAINVWHTQTHR